MFAQSSISKIYSAFDAFKSFWSNEIKLVAIVFERNF